ncbi:MAG: hypothetical protein IKW28_01990 [Lachnospiraceae bacterium]|nr:hypothetical protein [Lachnospiraceae bacterium]
MSTGAIVFIVIVVILIAAVVVLYFLGKKAQKKQEEQQAQIEAMKQTVSMLIIDKKRMKLKDAGFPQQVMDSANRFAKNAKLPVVKAKVGPQIMSLVCDEKIFDSIPVKKEVKATVSGIYITSVKGLHGKSTPVEVKKKSWWKRTVEKAQEKAGAKAVK